MAIALWIVQGLLALAFLGVGSMKLARSKDQLLEMGDNMAWAEDFSAGQIRGIGALEILGGLGLVLPMLTGILPVLTPWAGVGLALVMIGAMVTHIRRGENQALVGNTVLLALALIVAYGRFVAFPVA